MKNIILTGFMGTGKTSVSRELSRITGFPSMDSDAEIVAREKMSINDIFAKKGEKFFRDVETAIIKEISKLHDVIISTGGGAVLRVQNIEALKTNGVVVCLTASPEEILRRTKGDSGRPLLQVEDPLSKINELLTKRMPYYERADIMLETEGKTPRQIAEEILKEIGWKP